jgi:hypothetical protein
MIWTVAFLMVSAVKPMCFNCNLPIQLDLDFLAPTPPAIAHDEGLQKARIPIARFATDLEPLLGGSIKENGAGKDFVKMH